MDINKANPQELQEAFQVDGQRAEYIVHKREELGGFTSWEQFKQVVPGFEDKMVENLQHAGLTLNARSGQRQDHARETSHSSKQHESDRSDANRKRRKLDVNRATADQLKEAFQVDGERAEYIVSKRKELGGFKSWEQFKEVVPSFEDKMVENLEDSGFTPGSEDKAA